MRRMFAVDTAAPTAAVIPVDQLVDYHIGCALAILHLARAQKRDAARAFATRRTLPPGSDLRVTPACEDDAESLQAHWAL